MIISLSYYHFKPTVAHSLLQQLLNLRGHNDGQRGALKTTLELFRVTFNLERTTTDVSEMFHNCLRKLYEADGEGEVEQLLNLRGHEDNEIGTLKTALELFQGIFKLERATTDIAETFHNCLKQLYEADEEEQLLNLRGQEEDEISNGLKTALELFQGTGKSKYRHCGDFPPVQNTAV